MAYGKRATWDTIREETYDNLDTAYVVVGGTTTKSVRVVKFTNTTNKTVYFTDDNTEDQLKIPTNSFSLWDVTTNKALADKPQFIEIGTQFYCRYDGQVAPTSGWVSIELLIVESGS
jgi:hypothetical protein